MQRYGRQKDIERLRTELPLSPFFFDLLHLDGTDWLEAPTHERQARLDDLLSPVFWQDGRLVPDALAAIDYHLRDFRTGDVRPIDAGLLDLLHRLSSVMDYQEPIHVISGYRSPKTNAMLAKRSNGVAKKSYHLRGMAIDIRLPERGLAELRRAAQGLALGGVGYYPKSDFVHVDTGPVRTW
jgi:uncharacterized protein YcbK (DUF882 family)